MRGIGVDVVSLDHLNDVFGETFRDAVFTAAEIDYAEGSGYPLPHYATAFAGKEAVFKALRRGWTDGTDVEVRRDEPVPRAICSGALEAIDGADLLLSLSFDGEYAIAFAVYR
jgi:phosphopantetheine--protein transferase-like protein